MVRVFSEKNKKKEHLCCHYKNYDYFCKSNTPVINLIAGSRNMNEVSIRLSLLKVRLTTRVVFMKYRQFFSFFIVFEWGRIFESALDK